MQKPLFAPINAAAAGNNEVVAARAGKQIRVLGYKLICSAAVTAKWRSANTDLEAGCAYAANGGAACPPSELGWLQTAAGEALNLNLESAVQVSGHLVYALY